MLEDHLLGLATDVVHGPLVEAVGGQVEGLYGLAAGALTGVVPRERHVGVGQELVELGRQRVQVHVPGL